MFLCFWKGLFDYKSRSPYYTYYLSTVWLSRVKGLFLCIHIKQALTSKTYCKSIKFSFTQQLFMSDLLKLYFKPSRKLNDSLRERETYLSRLRLFKLPCRLKYLIYRLSPLVNAVFIAAFLNAWAKIANNYYLTIFYHCNMWFGFNPVGGNVG